VDEFHAETNPIEDKVTVKEIVLDLETAETEVKRLNQLNSKKQARYFYQATRLMLDE
jgi:hypothetical protein